MDIPSNTRNIAFSNVDSLLLKILQNKIHVRNVCVRWHLTAASLANSGAQLKFKYTQIQKNFAHISPHHQKVHTVLRKVCLYFSNCDCQCFSVISCD